MKKENFIFIRYIFLAIAVSISVYFGVHGYLLLEPKWGWQLALSTVVILEAIFLNVIIAYAYSKIGKVSAFAFGFLALVFSVALPLISSWEDYQKLDRIVAATLELSEPEYYSENVIPALETELANAKSVIALRLAEKKRRWDLGDEIYQKRLQKDGSIRLITGFEASSWIPFGEDEKAKFKKVDDLTSKITRYREKDKSVKNAFNEKRNSANASLAGAETDKEYGLWIFWFKFCLIIFLGVASLYYMRAYSNPETNEITINTIKPKKQVRDKNKLSVLERFPNAISEIVEGGAKVQIRASINGVIIGSAKVAPSAWLKARKNIENDNL